jgi:hypothetical protein
MLLLAGVLALLAIAGMEAWFRCTAPRAPLPGGGAAAAVPVLPPGLRAGKETIRLFADPGAVPADAGPVVQVLADGSIALRRGAVPARAPGQSTSRPAVVLPAFRLAALTPPQRLALLELVAALLEGRPVAAGRVELVGVAAGGGELARLLSWVP